MSDKWNYSIRDHAVEIDKPLSAITDNFSAIIRTFARQSRLYSGQPRILTVLKDSGGCTLSQLSAKTRIGMPSLSVSVRNLHKNGLVYYNQGRVRNRELYLTEEGEARAFAFHQLYDEFIKGLHEALIAEGNPETTVSAIKSIDAYLANYYNELTQAEE